MTTRVAIRRGLERVFDAVQFGAFLNDHFPDLSRRVAPGTDMDQQVTMLMQLGDQDGFECLVHALRSPHERPAVRELLPLVEEYRLTQRTLDAQRGAVVGRSGGADIGRVFSGQDDTQAAIARLVAPELDPVSLRPAALDMLEKLERLIRFELQKVGDDGFVELSMQLARSDGPATLALQQNLGIATVVAGLENPEPDIHTREELAQRVRQVGGAVLLAPPGSGKTTVLHHLTLHLMGEYRGGRSELIPLFVPLTRYALDGGDITSLLRGYLADVCAQPRHRLVTAFEDIAAAGRFFFVLDGLDQMAGRRSETARLELLHSVDRRLRRSEWLMKVAKVTGQRGTMALLMQQQASIGRTVAPRVDPREREIQRMVQLWASPVLSSCRVHDFVGVPQWQQIQILPMSRTQVQTFVSLYAPEAASIVERQFDGEAGSRSLVSNPFYLRMLTRAFESNRRRDGSLPEELQRALSRRGALLAHLIHAAVLRELNGDAPAAELAVRRIAELAYYMLQHNVIGGLPADAVQRIFGREHERMLNVARGAGLIEVRSGPPLSIEFNHQLFQEVLLALHLRTRSEVEGGFQESLQLLARRGDRWAETVKLLFEMTPDDRARELVRECAEALREPATWDIATRVLSEIGAPAASVVAPMLGDEDELVRRGTVNVLGRVGGIIHVDSLVELHRDASPHVRRAAVEALARLNRMTRLAAFENDTDPIVLRALYVARFVAAEDRIGSIVAALRNANPSHQLQAARAAHDIFVDLHQRQPPERVVELLAEMTGSAQPSVKILGQLCTAEAPVHIRRRMKQELLRAAIAEADPTINQLARRSVLDLLDPADLKEIEAHALPLAEALGMSVRAQTSSGARARWLLVEVEESRNFRGFLDALSSAGPEQTRLLTQRLASRGDALALGLLTYLLGHSATANHACFALASLGSNGLRHILAALDDPLPEVRLSAAEFLRFAHLPRRYASRVRRELKRARRWTFDVGIGIAGLNAQQMLIVGLLGPLSNGTLWWIASRLFQVAFGWTSCVAYATFVQFLGGGFFGGSALSREQVIVEGERFAFADADIKPTPDFWLARGRLLRALGRLDAARTVLGRCLQQEPSFEVARLELALVYRALHELDSAATTLEEDNRMYLARGSDLEKLHRLILIERDGGAGGPQGPEWLGLAVELRLWDEAQVVLLASPPDEAAGDSGDFFFFLYACYAGKSQTARALAASIECNRHGGARRVPEVELDTLRWQHRLERFAAEQYGRIGVLIDLGRGDELLAALREYGLAPEGEEPLQESHADRLRDLPSELAGQLIGRLDHLDPARAAEMRSSLSSTTLDQL